MANYLIMPYAKNNQNPAPGSPTLVRSVGTTLLYFVEDVEVEKLYGETEKAKGYLKSQDIIIVMGDVGDERIENVVGPSGSNTGTVRERGSRLIERCQVNDFTITNTWYQNHPRRQWTWKSPGDRIGNKIDYILIQKRF
ncbi:craniofacial development protein 2-like [Plakobranchus ocellatus]|uniref:Craniofacial development protein 2-like n=1 Tax=Plakobranchus ocellatus TaxID=259542 RepID=A0AAV3ZRA6_9GAST|nr:craniofacial development protein 2-like [Plakobranchus ocellatus]